MWCLCGVYVVLICSSSLLFFGASGGVCFVIGQFPRFLYFYV